METLNLNILGTFYVARQNHSLTLCLVYGVVKNKVIEQPVGNLNSCGDLETMLDISQQEL